MTAPFHVEADGRDFALLYKHIRAVDMEVGKALRKNMTAIGRPIADEVKSAALALPSKGGGAIKHKRGMGPSGLRTGIARSVQLKVIVSKKDRFNIRIRISGSAFRTATGKPATLPRYVEGLSRKAWRHPVMVKRENLPGPAGSWVTQAPTPFLLTTVMHHKGSVIKVVVDSFNEAVKNANITN